MLSAACFYSLLEASLFYLFVSWTLSIFSVRLHSMQIIVFLFYLSPDGSSKHVILFENMEEELVTVGV